MTTTSTVAKTPEIKKSSGVLAGKIFKGAAYGSGITILVILAAVAGFLMWQAVPALTASKEELQEINWFKANDRQATSLLDFVGPLIFGTLLVSIIALAIAVVLAVSIALFISHYAPRSLAQLLGYVIDLLAAIPSVIYGLWGALWLAPRADPVFKWLTENLGFIPIFQGYTAPAKNILTAALVLAVMILPIITAVSREVFLQTPKLQEEAAWGLGATRWEMIKLAVIPFGKSAVMSASMLGLGRALGETMAVLMILSPGALYSFFLLKPGQHNSIAANIALKFPEAPADLHTNVLVATGLALFVITFAVNALARWIIGRSSKAGK